MRLGWMALAAIVLMMLAGVIYLNTGKEECPHEIIHVLRPFVAEHNLHYRVTKRQDGAGTPYWSVQLWPKGEHWWNDNGWYVAGTKVPEWTASAIELKDAVGKVVLDVTVNPAGHVWAVTNTLQTCED